jgi:hypothetical protein
MQKILDSYGQRTRQEKKTSLSYHRVALSSLEQRKWKQQLNTRKKKLSVSRTVEMVTMFLEQKRKIKQLA